MEPGFPGERVSARRLGKGVGMIKQEERAVEMIFAGLFKYRHGPYGTPSWSVAALLVGYVLKTAALSVVWSVE